MFPIISGTNAKCIQEQSVKTTLLSLMTVQKHDAYVHFLIHLISCSLWSTYRMGIPATCWPTTTKRICRPKKCWCHLLHEFCHSAVVHDSCDQEWNPCNWGHRQWCGWWYVWRREARQWSNNSFGFSNSNYLLCCWCFYHVVLIAAHNYRCTWLCQT